MLIVIKRQTIIPKSKNIAKFGMPGFRIDEKTKKSTESKINGSIIDQRKPRTEFLYLFLRSPNAKAVIKLRLSLIALKYRNGANIIVPL